MNTDFEERVSGSLKHIVSHVSAEPRLLEESVTSRVAAQRRRRKTTAAVVGAAAAATLAVGAPVVVLHDRGLSDTASAGDPSHGLVQAHPTAATRYAQRLIAMVELPSGGTSTDSPPVHALARPMSHVPLTPRPTHVSQWWTYHRSAQALWQWVTRHKNPGLSLEQTMGDGFPIPPHQLPRANSVSFEPTAGLPHGFVYGDVTVLVASLGPGRAGVAVIATVEPTPPRPPAERVPASDVQAVVAWHRRPGGPTIHTSLDPAAASRLAQAFDLLPRTTIGPHSCPPLLADNDVTVTFRAQGHQWKATYRGCFEVSVTRDGATLPALTTSTGEATSRPPGQRRFLNELKADGIRLP